MISKLRLGLRFRLAVGASLLVLAVSGPILSGAVSWGVPSAWDR